MNKLITIETTTKSYFELLDSLVILIKTDQKFNQNNLDFIDDHDIIDYILSDFQNLVGILLNQD